jgi:1,4-dihydroxy-2-naphthoyl-CoA hydrolase
VPAVPDLPDLETYPAPGTLDDVLGFELLEAGPERCRGRFAAEARVQQPAGLVHGGAYAALAESLASVATYRHVSGDGNFAVGMSNHTTFLRPVTEGEVSAEGKVRHRGRTTWVWDIDFTDAGGRACAVSRVTLAVRPWPGSRSGS